MARDTKYDLRKCSIYQLFPFIHSKEGTLRKLEDDLLRIKDMGFDYIYLLPVQERGVLNRKGTFGSPYAIKDYYSIDKNIGTMEDFEHLVNKCHEVGLKIMMDVVINHSGCDCVYTETHPEYYLKDKDGNFTRKVADWSDVYDFDYSCNGLREELLKMLSFWANKGIDGIRCDVASLVPVDFWLEARKTLKNINPDFVMLAESVHSGLVQYARFNDFYAASDNDLYEAFDILYSYDIANEYNEATKEKKLERYINCLNYQQACFPKNALKLFHLENHDYPRIYNLVKDKDRARNWTAFSFLTKGVSFVYAGQECFADHMPDFFEKDDVDWTKLDKEHVLFIKKLNELKKAMFNDDDYIDITYEGDKAIVFKQKNKEEEYIGIFNVNMTNEILDIKLETGTYLNLIDNTDIEIRDNKYQLDNRPVLIKRKVK
ncbi:MAG: alpha-amylase family glycosyl hydrolase [Erysipelotrichaceae bacterium]|nr:alpha-amylase family glycosyl hydrolase [Erysipelotrichaceae bacterium]